MVILLKSRHVLIDVLEPEVFFQLGIGVDDAGFFIEDDDTEGKEVEDVLELSVGVLVLLLKVVACPRIFELLAVYEDGCLERTCENYKMEERLLNEQKDPFEPMCVSGVETVNRNGHCDEMVVENDW